MPKYMHMLSFVLVLVSLILIPGACNVSAVSDGVYYDVPKLTTGQMVSEFADKIASRNFDMPKEENPFYFDGSIENSVIFDGYPEKGRLVSPTEYYDYYFTVFSQAEDNGLALMDTLYQWRKEGTRIIRTHNTLFPNEMVDVLDGYGTTVWMDNFVTYLRDIPDEIDINEYRNKAIEHIAEINEMGSMNPVPETAELSTVSKIADSWYAGEALFTLECWCLEFDIETFDNGYTKLRYLIDTGGDEDKVLWLLYKCEAGEKKTPPSVAETVGSSDIPVYAIRDIVPKITTPIRPKYIDIPDVDRQMRYIQKSDENKTLYVSGGAPYGESTEYYYQNWFQAGDNGVELMDDLYRWILPEIEKRQEQRASGLVAIDAPGSSYEWMSDYITYPEEVFDTTAYKEKAVEKVADLYETKFPGEAPTDLTLNPVVPRIQASFEYEGEHIDLDCWVLEFDVKQTETAYQKIYFLVDTSGEEDKFIWMFVDCFKVEKQ